MNTNTQSKHSRRIAQLILLSMLISAILTVGHFDSSAQVQIAAGPTISDIAVVTPGLIEKYAKFEVAFDITDTTATNMYFPYDSSPPISVEAGTGISVDMQLLSPGESNWGNAKTLPCFYYQPVEERGSGSQAQLLPVGNAEWRCRFTPDVAGTWQYRIGATDAGGASESSVLQFTAIESNRKGFVKVSTADPRFFEFSDGTPFAVPLINVEQANPLNTLSSARTNIAKYGASGVRFLRWFPTGEGANYLTAPFGDTITVNWSFGPALTSLLGPDTAAGKRFSFSPYYYSAQPIPSIAGARYRLTFSTDVGDERVLRAEIGNLAYMDICSAGSTHHESNGNSCTAKQDGWHEYSFEVTSPSATTLWIGMRGLYVSTDAPAPFNTTQDGYIRLHSIQLQRDETGNGDWGPNLLNRSDPDTYNYVDQRSAALLDEIFALSEQNDVYHKVTLFHKNDRVLNRFNPDGTIMVEWDSLNAPFYSQDGLPARWYEHAYARYFVARWSYSPALHSIELANENHLTGESYDAGFALAQLVHDTSPRHILMSNSFWGWFVTDFWTNPTRGHLMDYADKHWYASESATDPEVISNTTDDFAANVRECWSRFREYEQAYNLNKPIVRGETGVTVSGTEPQHPDVAQDSQGTYYHKKLWAHVGTAGYNCDGEWYPDLLNTFNLWGMFAAYERFMQGEPLSNGHHEEVGTDLAGSEQILLSGDTGNLRAWGVRDAVNGRLLLWIDNSDHTWKNVVDGVQIGAAGGNLTVQGLPEGGYDAEWWDTTSGTVTGTGSYAVGADGQLGLTISNLNSDVALKVALSSPTGPTPTPTSTATSTSTPENTPTPTHTATPTPTSTSTTQPTNTPSPTATATTQAGGVTIRVDPAVESVGVGDTFEVVMQVQAGAQAVDVVGAYLNFDPALLQVVSVTTGTTLPTVVENNYDNGAGRVNYAAGLLGSTTSGTFALATVTFEAIAETAGTVLDFATVDPRRTDAALAGTSVLDHTESGSVTITNSTLNGNVMLQGRQPAPAVCWITDLSLSLTVSGESSPRYTFTPTTNDMGQFSVNDIEPGIYDVQVKGSHTLQNVGTFTLTGGVNNVDLGVLREGDANDDNAVTLTDFSVLSGTFGRCTGDAGYDDRADFNEDGCITINDFSLLAGNFGRVGDTATSMVLHTAPASLQAGNVVISAEADAKLSAGDVFAVTILVQTGDQPVDGAAGYLNFDPAILQVLSIMPGKELPNILQISYDNNAGTIDYAAGLLGEITSGSFTLATITFEALVTQDRIPLSFSAENLRMSDATLAGVSVLGKTAGCMKAIDDAHVSEETSD